MRKVPKQKRRFWKKWSVHGLIGARVYLEIGNKTAVIARKKERMKHVSVIVCGVLLCLTPFSAVKAEELVIEPIIFGLNKSQADIIPDWQGKADKIIDRVNEVFSKTTRKRFKINTYLTYPDALYGEIYQQPEKHPEFYQNYGTTGGITYLLSIHPDGLSGQQFKDVYGTEAFNVMAPVYVNNKEYAFVLQVVGKSGNPLEDPRMYGSDDMPLHEIGHAHGLASPDWYLYRYSDATGVEPTIPEYAIQSDDYYRYDPMVKHDLSQELMGSGQPNHRFEKMQYKFSELNTAIIEKNIDRKHSFSTIDSNWYSKKTRVRVVDQSGTPVSGARVTVYGMLRGCWYCSGKRDTQQGGYRHGVTDRPPIEQEGRTDERGELVIKSPQGIWYMDEPAEGAPPIVKAVKVYANGLSAARAVSYLDVQKSYVLNNNDEYVLTLMLGEKPIAQDETNISFSNATPTSIAMTWKSLKGYPIMFSYKPENNPFVRSELMFLKSEGLMILLGLLPNTRYAYSFGASITPYKTIQREGLFTTLGKPADPFPQLYSADLPAVENLLAVDTGTTNSVKLTWQLPKGYASQKLRIYRSQGGTLNQQVVGEVKDAIEFYDNATKNNWQYEYRIHTLGSNGAESFVFPTASVYVSPVPSLGAQNVRLSRIPKKGVKIEWDIPKFYISFATAFVYRSTKAGTLGEKVGVTKGRSFIDTKVKRSSKPYFYTVRIYTKHNTESTNKDQKSIIIKT